MIKNRKELGISQDDIAQIIDVSRPTVAKIERGEKEMTPKQIQLLENYFASISGSQEKFRINIPQKNIEKFEQIFLYILDKVGAKPNVGLTVIYKLLYFIDFDYYERYETQCMGLTYFKNRYGPTPREFKLVVDKMIENGVVEAVRSTHFRHEQEKYLPINEPDLSVINGAELEIIESVLNRYADKNASQLSEMSHRDTPWKATEDNADIDYELAFYRPDEFSVGLSESL